MRRLGEMLVEKGAISLTELHTGLDACRRDGGRLGTRLMSFGFLGEHSLLEALAQQHGVPYVSLAMLHRSRTVMQEVLPPEVLRRLRVVPFKKLNKRLQVAMCDPSDHGVIGEISGMTNLRVEPFVATDRTIGRALAELPSAAPDPRRPDVRKLLERAPTPVGGWDRLWTGHLDPGALLRVRSRPRPAGTSLLASFPGLKQVGPVRSEAPAISAQTEEIARLLDDVGTANEVGDLLIRFAARSLDRVCLLSVHRGQLSGWISRGVPLDAASVQTFSVFADAPSIFSEVRDVDQFVGPVPSGLVNDQLMRIFGDPRPSEVAIIPVRVKLGVKAYLLGDLVGRQIPAAVINELVAAAQVAGDCLGTVLSKKSGSA